MRTSNYNFDIDKHSLIKPVVIIRSGDHDIDTIKITLSNQGEPVDLTNAKVTFMGTTATGNKIIDDAHIKIVDATSGIFEYTFPSAAGSSVGEYQDAYFSIVMGNGQTSTMNFRIQVLSGVDISAPAASDYVSQYNTMVSNLNSAYDSATHETNDKMASTVSSLATSAATVLDSALARVNDVNSTANSASSAASNAVSMASSVASTVTSQASYINSVASSAASNVSSVAASVVDKLNNLSIGGRNLMLGTSDWSGGSARWDQKGTVTTDTYRGALIASTSKAWTSPAYRLQNAGILQVGKTYTFSTYVRNTSDTDTKVASYYDNGIWSSGTNTISLPAHTDWIRVSTTFKVIKDPTTSTSVLRWEAQNALTNGQIQFAGYKLEEGNVGTDWTPAPEDLSPKLDIGGRNYILNSSGVGASPSSRPVLSGGVTDNSNLSLSYYPDRIVMTNNQGNASEFFYGLTKAWTDITQTPLIAGNTYTLSVKVRGTSPQAALRVGYQGTTNDERINYTQLDSTKWTKATFTFTLPAGTARIFVRINGGINNRTNGFTGNETIEFKEVMLEQSNIASDWTPAPEDMASATGRGKIIDGADLNNYTEPYKYVIEGATNIANYPSGANVWAILEVDKINSATFTQKITDTDNRVFLRTYAGARPVWSAWIQLSNDGNVLHKTGNETAAGDKTFTGKVAVSGTLDAVQKVYSRTIGSTNDLLINYTRVGNLVTGRYNVKFGGTFPLGANDGYKSPSAYPVNVISYNANAWFMPDNTFHADTGSTGNFMFITNDPLPSN